MAITILPNPNFYEFFFLGNPIPFTVEDADVNFKRFLYKVTVNAVDSEEYESYRFGGNQAILNLKSLLERFFPQSEYPLPDLTDADIELIANNTQVCKSFTLTAESEYTVGSPTTDTLQAWAVMGGVPFRRFPTHNTFEGSFENAYVGLTPYKTKKTDPASKEFLYFLNIELANVAASFSMQIELYKDNEVDPYFIGSQDFTDLQKGKVSIFDVSYQKIVQPYSNLNITKYRVRIISTYTILTYNSDWYYFEVDRNNYAQKNYFAYQNTFGGMSVIRLTGERKADMEVNRSEAAGYISPNYTMPTSGEFINDVEVSERFTIDSGFQFESYEEFQQFKDFFQSKKIYEISGTDLLPVKLLTKKLPIGDDDKTEIPNVKLEFQYLFDSNFEA